MTNTIGIALSGLMSATRKVAAAASNIANLNTAGSLTPGQQAPYQSVTTADTAQAGGGVKTEVIPKNPPFVPAYDPDSPFADAQGLIGVPNTDLASEAVNLTLAKTAYKANLAVLKTEDEMQDALLKSFDRKA